MRKQDSFFLWSHKNKVHFFLILFHILPSYQARTCVKLQRSEKHISPPNTHTQTHTDADALNDVGVYSTSSLELLATLGPPLLLLVNSAHTGTVRPQSLTFYHDVTLHPNSLIKRSSPIISRSNAALLSPYHRVREVAILHKTVLKVRCTISNSYYCTSAVKFIEGCTGIWKDEYHLLMCLTLQLANKPSLTTLNLQNIYSSKIKLEGNSQEPEFYHQCV